MSGTMAAREALRRQLIEAAWDDGMMHCDSPAAIVDRVLAVRDAELDRLSNQVRDYENQLVTVTTERDALRGHLRSLYETARDRRNNDDLEAHLDQRADSPEFVASFVAATLRSGLSALSRLAELREDARDPR